LPAAGRDDLPYSAIGGLHLADVEHRRAQARYRVLVLHVGHHDLVDTIDPLGEHRLDQRVPVGEVPIDGTDADPRMVGDGVEGQVHATFADHCVGRLEKQRPVAKHIPTDRPRRCVHQITSLMQLMG